MNIPDISKMTLREKIGQLLVVKMRYHNCNEIIIVRE